MHEANIAPDTRGAEKRRLLSYRDPSFGFSAVGFVLSLPNFIPRLSFMNSQRVYSFLQIQCSK
jgi:hypothetical protein